MATTTNLKTRIKLKYDTLANWVANDPVLLQGEIALVDPGVTAADGSATVLIKVGRSGKKFSECPYLWANAADVPSWAKNGTKPEYTYSEIKNTPTIGNGTITINQGGTTKGTFTLNATGNTAINLSDANTTYKLVQDASDGHKIKLQASTDGGTTWTDVSDYITIPDNDHTYTAASLGLGSVVNKGMDSTPTASSTNYVTSGGVKSYVDKAIGDLTKFDIVKYDSFDKLPTTGVKGTIYIVPDSHSDSNDSYDEYLWNTALATPAYEKIGNTDVATATADKVGLVKGGTTSGKNYGVTVASDGSMTVNVPWTDTNTDTKVTSAANHYAPSADSSAALSASASSTTAATWNSTSLVTGVNLQRDSKGHVTGVTVNSIKMPANPNTDTNTAHSHTAGVGLTATGTGGTSGSVSYKVNLADETANTSAALTKTSNANRLYPVEVDKNGKLAVTVPWTDTQTATANNAALKDAAGNTIFTANASADVQISVIDCGSSTDVL